MAHIKLFTLNVWSGFRYHGLIRLEEYETKQVREKRFQGLCAVLRKERPDIVCLNEANPLFSYGKRLAEELGINIATNRQMAVKACSLVGRRLGA